MLLINFFIGVGVFPLLYALFLYPVLLFLIAIFIRPKEISSFKHSESKNLKISFLLPAYNEEKYILHKLNNIIQFAKDFNFEMVVANDGSSDKTAELIERFQLENPNIKVKFINQSQNLGKWEILKKIIEESSGEVLVFSDISSLLTSGLIEKAISVLSLSNYAVYAPTYKFKDYKQSFLWEKIYWPIERFIKQKEALIYSTIGAHGAGYFIKKSHLINLKSLEVDGAAPINDDFLIPTMSILTTHSKIFYDSNNAFLEIDIPTPVKESLRRERISNGNHLMNKYLIKEMFKNKNFKLLFFLFSHKIIREYIGIGLVLCLIMLLFHKLYGVVLMALIILSFLAPFRATVKVFIHRYIKKATEKEKRVW